MEDTLTPSQVLQDVIMLDKAVAIEFDSEESFKNFRSALYMARYRMKEQVKLLGFGDIQEADLVINTTILSGSTTSPPIQVKFSGKPKQQSYKILYIEDIEE